MTRIYVPALSRGLMVVPWDYVLTQKCDGFACQVHTIEYLPPMTMYDYLYLHKGVTGVPERSALLTMTMYCTCTEVCWVCPPGPHY